MRFCIIDGTGQSRAMVRATTLICAISLSVCTALAQSTPHPIIRGMVADPRRVPLPDALVTAVDTATQAIFRVHTDSAGEYTLQGLSPGVLYLIIVRKPGFVPFGTHAKLHPADTVDLHFMLASDTMSVAAAPIVVPPLVRGTVVDSTQAPLAAAMVTAVDSATNKTIVSARTDSAGRFTFSSLSAGVPYLIAVRRIGSIEGVSHTTLHPGDTLNLKVVLVPVTQLAAVHVTAQVKMDSHDITADEIAQSNRATLDGYDVVLRLRPMLLGDPFKGCMTDSSKFTFGAPRPQPSRGDSVAQDPRRFTFGIGSWALGLFKDGGGQIYRKDADKSSVDAPARPDSSYPFRLYVNGVVHFAPGAKNILSQIPVDDIQEMHYIDCLDTTTPEYRNSLMVTLKPGKSY